jgi:ABC-type dipeptide/oligopeptide/nickel transport system ATPase component
MLSVKNLRVHFYDAPEDEYAVNDVSFSIDHGDILGLVGESGSGKTLTAMSIAGLLDTDRASCSGSIILDGVDLLSLEPEQLRRIRGRDIGVVFQEPMTAMNPVIKIGPQVEESLRIHTDLDKAARKAAALDAMDAVELDDPETVYNKYPHELSGGMLQRVMIAAAIISKPKMILADEPTTALDVIIQAQILQLLKKINSKRGTSILFISHNLNVVRKLCERVCVMQGGILVEEGPTEQIFRHPKQPYTQKLIAAIPTRDKKLR